MKIEQQVTSLELSKRLQKLEVKQESLFYWWSLLKNEYILKIKEELFSKTELFAAVGSCYSAFTASELLEMLPVFIQGYNQLTIQKCNNGFETFYSCSRTELGFDSKDECLTNSLAKMLIYLLENKLMELKNVD